MIDGAYGVSWGRVCCITVGLVWTLLHRSILYSPYLEACRCRGTLRDDTYALKRPLGRTRPTLGTLSSEPSPTNGANTLAILAKARELDRIYGPREALNMIMSQDAALSTLIPSALRYRSLRSRTKQVRVQS